MSCFVLSILLNHQQTLRAGTCNCLILLLEKSDTLKGLSGYLWIHWPIIATQHKHTEVKHRKLHLYGAIILITLESEIRPWPHCCSFRSIRMTYTPSLYQRSWPEGNQSFSEKHLANLSKHWAQTPKTEEMFLRITRIWFKRQFSFIANFLPC